MQTNSFQGILITGGVNCYAVFCRQTALHNIQRLCPSLAKVLINTYRVPSELYVDMLLSQEEPLRATHLPCQCMP